MRRPLLWLLRAVRDDSGLTAVEYAVLTGLIIVFGGATAFWLGQSVNNTSERVTWTAGPSGAHHVSLAPAAGSLPLVSPLRSAGRLSYLPWALLSLGASIALVGGFFGWHYLRDIVRQGNSRRRVRQSLTGADGQAALQRLVRKPSREPIMPIKRPDTHLIGRNGPDLHHWVNCQSVTVSGDLARMGGRTSGPETDAGIIARQRPISSSVNAMPSSPAAPVAG